MDVSKPFNPLRKFSTNPQGSRTGFTPFWKRCSVLFVALIVASLVGCSSIGQPKNTENLCLLFDERGYWYRAALRAERRWYVDIPVLMAIIYQESSFVGNARPKRKRLLGVIPIRPASSAYGYAQAQIPAWRDYIKRNRRIGATRDDFADAVDFVGWYTDTAARTLKLSRKDAKHLYLSYHEGLTGFRRGAWRKSSWLIAAAEKVQTRSEKYRAQLQSCRRGPARRYRSR